MTPAANVPGEGNDCWNRIGVWGDRTCPELEKLIHCHNCPVFSAAGLSLLERLAPPGYLEDWTRLLTLEKEAPPSDTRSVVVFQLGSECLALPTALFKEAAEVRVVHRIPHRSSSILKGLVNIGGELLLCVSIGDLLELEAAEGTGSASKHTGYKRMAVVDRSGERWVFEVDEILGVHRLAGAELQAVPVNVAKASSSYTRGVFLLRERKVALLDDELVFNALKRSIR